MIEIFEGNYNKKDFYKKMGRFFAEPPFSTTLLPYMKNTPNHKWYLNIKNGKVVAFSSILIHKKSIVFDTDFFLLNINDLEEILKVKLKELEELGEKLNIRTVTSVKEIKVLFEKYNFQTYKETKNYFFLNMAMMGENENE